MNISDFLNRITELIENDDLTGTSNLISQYVMCDPSIIDERFKAELAMIEKMMDYKSNLKDWAYFRLMRVTYQYIEKQYAVKLPESVETIETDQNLPDSDIIWCCWLQGKENAPDIVKKCMNSLERFGRKIVILTEDNILEYADIPYYIIEKKKRGIITNTHFTDILRAELLSKRGGTWIDATVFCSDPEMTLKVIECYPLFCYSFAMRDSISDNVLFDSWFIHCSQRSSILEDTRALLYMYWENEDRLMHYFLFHLMFTISCRRHTDESDKIPLFSLEPCHILQKEMAKPFDEVRWDHIMKMSGIHKLTYKYEPFDLKETMLEHILSMPDL